METHRIRHITEIGKHADANSVGLDAESHWIHGVVRNGEGVYLEVSNAETLAGHERLQARLVVPPGNSGRGQPRHVHRKLVFLEKRNQSANMIAVLMRDEDSIQGFRAFAD